MPASPNPDWPLCEKCESERLEVIRRWGKKPNDGQVSVILRHRGVYFITPESEMNRAICAALNLPTVDVKRRLDQIREDYKCTPETHREAVEGNLRLLHYKARKSVQRLEQIIEGGGSETEQRRRGYALGREQAQMDEYEDLLVDLFGYV